MVEAQKKNELKKQARERLRDVKTEEEGKYVQ
jgi:hypothetical protein